MVKFNEKIQKQFEKMCATGKLFRVEVEGKDLWDTYLASFETDPIFRDPESSEHNCNLCNNFIRRYGNIVAIDSKNKIMSIFDITIDGEYKAVAKALADKIKKSVVKEVFFETYTELNSLNYEKCTKTATIFQLGLAKNFKRYTKEEAEKFGVVKADEVRTFNHMHMFVPQLYVDQSGASIEQIMAKYRDAKNVFQRAMEEIPASVYQLVIDLINQGSLLDGTTHVHKIKEILPLKQAYDKLSTTERDNWCWVNSYRLPFAKFKNELVGVLCTELAEGVELNKACEAWNKRVDPANYMKAVAPITETQKKEAQKFIEENGYVESFARRFAVLDDIKVSEILHSNVGDGKIKKVSLFDSVKVPSTQHKKAEFDNVEEVSIDKFMSDILPTCTNIEAYVENKHEKNFVTLTTADDSESKPIFKWDNNYSWTYNGNLAGKSQIKEAVKSRGGNVEGVLRVSLFFPHTTDDYDLHLKEPKGTEIYYGNRRSIQLSSGTLDLDAQGADGSQVPEKRVENIIYTDKGRMPIGTYRVFLHNYSGRGLHTKFTVEIEIEGAATLLELKKTTTSNTTDIVNINFDGRDFTLDIASGMEILSSKTISKEVYGLETNKFHKVNLVSLSPNHWGENAVGNKHYFFMLDKCKTTEPTRSFHNENLIPSLAEHRKVLEVLGASTMLEPTDKMLSGVGFNSTIKDDLLLKISGSHKRMLRVKFA